MRSRHLFLLVYLSASFWAGTSRAQRNGTCVEQDTCVQGPDPTSRFMQCVGLPPTDTGKDHMMRLKGIIEASLDVYSFMKSSMMGVPLLNLEAELELNPEAEAFQDEALVKMWLEIKIRPLLRSITKNFLTCLSIKNFTCATYQTVVKKFSHHFSEMEPARQKWIYTFFMYPFLSGDGVNGCVRPGESSEDWLMKNFGSFRAMARMKDFSTLNMVFSGLEVLHLLSSEQKAELLLRPEVAGLDNGTLSLVFHSLMTGGQGPRPTTDPGESHNWTGLGYTHSYSPRPTYDPYLPPSPQDSIRQVLNGFVGAVGPIGSLVREFVSLTRKFDVSEIRSTTLTQAMLNWTLAELASVYKPHNASLVPEREEFDVTDVEDWYHQVVMPVLRRFLPKETPIRDDIKFTFHQIFYLDSGMGNDTNEIEDACSITIDERSCGMTNAVENVARVMHCAAHSNLTMSEGTIMRMVEELTNRLNSLVIEFTTANFSEVASHFKEVFGQVDSPSLTHENLEDPDFIKLWFKVKLLPLLPEIPTGLLSCLSTKNFTCPVYQALVKELSEHARRMDEDNMYSPMIYTRFIYPFLLHHNTSDPQCVSSANHSEEWLEKNFGFFSRFASLRDFYKLNPGFSALESLDVLTPEQTAELLVLPLPTPPEKDVVIHAVFDYLTESPEDRELPEVLDHLVDLAEEESPPCGVYRLILERLYRAIPSLPQELEPDTWDYIDDLIHIAPEDCLPENVTCPATPFNGVNICRGVNSNQLQQYLSTSTSMDVPCNFTLETYACAQTENFTAYHLVSLLKCNLPGNNSRSKMIWKMLLTKLSPVLDPALDLLANMSMAQIGPSASEVLDVIGELRVSLLTDEQLRDSDVIRRWFSWRLRAFLSSASERFLHCLSNRNLSCQSYQEVLRAFGHQFDSMTSKQRHLVLREFILPFLSRVPSDKGCASTSNSSKVWLQKNLGPFSVLISLRDLLELNPDFSPLESLDVLSPEQTAELLVLPLPAPPENEVVIHAVFDYLTESPEDRELPEVLDHLVDLAEEGNISCSTYRIIFTKLDYAILVVPADMASSVTYSKLALSEHMPPGCILYSGDCKVTPVNETRICAGVNSTVLQTNLDNGQLNGRFCDFGVEEYACASLLAFRAEDLAAVLKCNWTSDSMRSRHAWKLFLSKASVLLDSALDILANMTFTPSGAATSLILDSISETRLNAFTPDHFQSPAFIQLWFNRRLRPFLSAVSTDFLSCLSTKNLSCSTYQDVVQILSHHRSNMELSRQISVYTHFIKLFLTRNQTADPSCISNHPNSGEWLKKNFGGFSALVSFQDLQSLNSNFSALEALPQLTVRQLAEVSSTPGQLTSPAQVTMVMDLIPDRHFAAFFDGFSTAVMGHENLLPSAVRSAMLQAVFDRANLSDHSVSDGEVLVWLHRRLRPLLFDLSALHVAPFFSVVAGRNCTTEQQAVAVLNSSLPTLDDATQKEIHNHIIQSLREPKPLRCYGDDYSHSFYGFLVRSFMGFQFPNLTTVLSLMPVPKRHQLVNSLPPSDLGEFLRRPGVVDDDADLCQIYHNYIKTPMFLETEALPTAVRRPTLPCIWPMALNSSERSEVNAWFDRRLPNYLAFLTKSLLTSSATHNASCLAFQKLVSVLGRHNYNAADFAERDVYNTIKAYLASGTVPKCYDANDPELNSTAWFAEYIGPFMPFLTLEDLNTFGSAQVIQVFTVNPLNIALLNHSILPLNLTNYYTELIYLQDSNFNPMLLPLLCRCVAPGLAFSQLTGAQSIIILHNLTTHCTDLDPQVSAALAGNLGNNIDASSIAALGNESIGMSTGQINMASPEGIHASLGILSNVMDWNQGQAMAIIQSLVSSGLFQINNASSLMMLGSLVVGVPAATLSGVSGSELLSASQNPAFLTHLMTAPQIIQQTFVTQIISVNSNSERIIENVPDEMASEIPRSLLLGFSNTNITVVQQLNRKKWKRKQAVLFFNTVAVGTENANDLSSYVLQGFTCTSVAAMSRQQIRKLVKASRRKGKKKVKLLETQLTCMYNYIKGDTDATDFSLYPPDVLLYYDYSLVPQATCRSYFEEVSGADFSVFSSVLSYKLSALIGNAMSCLGVAGTNLSTDNILVLGNMCCALDASYIQNSHPSILEKLKNCPDFTNAQVSAMETVLLTGTTAYGAPSTWNRQTLENLQILPLYLTETFYSQFDKRTKRRFLKSFVKVLKSAGVQKKKIRNMKKAIRRSIKNKSKRSIANDCTVGTITQVTIRDESFPFDYDTIAQFNCCLGAETVKDNLAAIIAKVDQEEYLSVVLNKLREAYAANSTIPEENVQVLGAASRMATTDDISLWKITNIDTLSALMDSSDGEWDPSKANAIISKYLSKEGNSLGSSELNSVGGPNLCSLDLSVLKTISQDSLSKANALTLSNCTLEKKREMFIIARGSFSGRTRSTVSASTYQLIQTYLVGADVEYVRSLATSNISMDMDTFTGLDENVVLALNVNEVKGLLGTNLPELKSYENQTLVQNWARMQTQSDLDTLGIGLSGGRTANSTASPSTATVAPGSSSTTTGSATSLTNPATSANPATTGNPATSGTSTNPSITSTTGNGGASIRPDAGLSSLVVLVVFMTSHLILH